MKTLFYILISLIASTSFGQLSNWHEVPTNTDHKLNTISFGSDMVGYIGGNDSLLLKTTDGGATWTEVNHSGLTFFGGGEHILNVKFVSEDVGYLTVGPYGGTYKTVDGGLNWTAVTFAGNMCFNQGLFVFSEGEGFVGGSGCFQGEHIEKMSGDVMSTVTLNTPSWDAMNLVLDIDFYDNTFGLAVSKERYLRTMDGGATWDTIPIGFADCELTSVEIFNDSSAYVGYRDLSSNFGLLLTTDHGQTWTQDIDVATFYYPDYNDVGEANNGYLFSCGGVDGMNPTGLIFENKGSWWNYYPVDHMLNGFDSYGDSTVFMVGDSGYVVTNVNPQTLSVDDEEEIYNLELYPNPTTDELNLLLPFELQHNANISILDLNGRIVKQVDAITTSISVAELGVGVYVLTIQQGDQMLQRKFIKQ